MRILLAAIVLVAATAGCRARPYTRSEVYAGPEAPTLESAGDRATVYSFFGLPMYTGGLDGIPRRVKPFGSL